MRAKEAIRRIGILLQVNAFGDSDPQEVLYAVDNLRLTKAGTDDNDPSVEGSAAFYKEGRDLLKADNDRLNAELAQLRLWKDAHVTPTRDPSAVDILQAGIAARDLVIADLRKEKEALKEQVDAFMRHRVKNPLDAEQEVS